MENKQTAVEWLGNEIWKRGPIGEDTPIWLKELYEQAKAMQNEQLEKELISFFLYFRENGERLLGASIEQLVKSYLSSKI